MTGIAAAARYPAVVAAASVAASGPGRHAPRPRPSSSAVRPFARAAASTAAAAHALAGAYQRRCQACAPMTLLKAARNAHDATANLVSRFTGQPPGCTRPLS